MNVAALRDTRAAATAAATGPAASTAIRSGVAEAPVAETYLKDFHFVVIGNPATIDDALFTSL